MEQRPRFQLHEEATRPGCVDGAVLVGKRQLTLSRLKSWVAGSSALRES